MNFVVFPVGATNIFPLANSSAGGQLLSEFNIRSRESVETDPNVKYFIGKSFTHSMDDFEVFCQRDGHDVTISNTAIQIQPGRAIVNGHYVESLTPVTIDINDANTLAQRENITPLKGKLAVGLRMAYSTYQTLAGSALTENEDGYYEGVQVVVLPADAVKLPKDVPGDTQFSKVNMHLLLATFTFRNGAVSSVTQNADKIKSIDASRVSNMDNIFSDIYVSKVGLDPNKIYTFAGKSSDGQNIDGRDTWCDSTDSLMVWDNHPTISTNVPSNEAFFRFNTVTGDTELVMPHKQVDGMVNTQGTTVYYQDKTLSLPAADFAGHGGVVSPEYTRRVREMDEKINLYYTLPNGRMRQFIPLLTDRADLPVIPATEDTRWPYSDSEYGAVLAELKLSIKNIKTRVDRIDETLESVVKLTVEEVLPSAVDRSSTISGLQTSIQTINDNIDQLLDRVARLEEKTTETGTAPTREEFVALQTTVTEIRGDVNALQTTVASLNTGLTDRVRLIVAQELTSIREDIDAEYANLTFQLEGELKDYIDDWMHRELDDRSIITRWRWMPGDYILVGEDRTVESNINGRYPTTMYVVRPGVITSVRFLGQDPANMVEIDLDTNDPNYVKNKTEMYRQVPGSLAGGVQLDAKSISSTSELSTDLWDLTGGQYIGAIGIDYFVARLRTYDESTGIENWKCYFYTPATTATTYTYSDPIWVTGGVPLATTSSIGGFVSAPSDAYGNGYVSIDENGYLRVNDFELLLTGVLAFQLGQNREEGAGLAIEEIQTILEDEVNDRVCFPNAYQIVSATESGVDPHVIHLYLTLPEEAGELTIHDIGSRYGSSLHVHILGSATSATVINFLNIDKLRIDSDIEGAPTINLDNVNLYYDAEVIDACNNISNMTLWYQQYTLTDPDLQVDGMTVSLVGPIETTEGIDPWDSTYANDNHYSYSLRSITLGSDGSILNVGMLVGDSTTANIDEGKSAFAAEFILPQSIGLNYPVTRMTHQIKVTGSFISHYWVAQESAYMMKHTDFSAITQKYDRTTLQNVVTGTISFYTDAEYLSHINGITPGTTVDGWDLNTPHYFVGGIVE